MELWTPETICDGPHDCRRATRHAIKYGADWIKITATGGVLSDTATGLNQQMTEDELQEIMDEDYLDLLRTYLGNAPELIGQTRMAIESGDAAAMVLPVHSLKSSSANVGAMRLSELAKEAEQLAKAGDLVAAERAFRAVEKAFTEAESALRAHLAAQMAAR